MANTNKVLFGFSDLYVGTYTESNGTVTLGTPYHQAGAVGFSPEDNVEQNTFYADNVAYYVTDTAGSTEGDLVVAKFDDQFLKDFLGYAETTTGGLAQIKGANKPKVYLAFEVQGDGDPIRVIYYNATLGSVVREYATIEDSVEVQTETLAVTIAGDNTTGIVKAVYDSEATGYATLFTAPPAPALAP